MMSDLSMPSTVWAADNGVVPLYQPPNPKSSATFRFLARVNAAFNLSLASYSDLYTWSTNNIDDFWGLVWDETEIIGHKGSHVVDKSALPSTNPPWFSEAKVNWAENMLKSRSAEKVALIQASAFSFLIFNPDSDCITTLAEPTPDTPNPEFRRCTYSKLYSLVADLVSALLLNGLKPGDRVASYSSNCIVGLLATHFTWPPSAILFSLVTLEAIVHILCKRSAWIAAGGNSSCAPNQPLRLLYPGKRGCMHCYKCHRGHLGQCCGRLWSRRGTGAVSSSTLPQSRTHR